MDNFKAACDLILHTLKGEPSSNVEGAKKIFINKGEDIPEAFVVRFLKRNRELIADLPIKDGLPQLTEEQEKKYKITFIKPKPKTFSEEVEKYYPKYDLENLKQRIAKYIKKNGAKAGKEKFKNWAEKEFGEEKIDKRKSPDNIIVQILNLQDEEKI